MKTTFFDIILIAIFYCIPLFLLMLVYSFGVIPIREYYFFFIYEFLWAILITQLIKMRNKNQINLKELE